VICGISYVQLLPRQKLGRFVARPEGKPALQGKGFRIFIFVSTVGSTMKISHCPHAHMYVQYLHESLFLDFHVRICRRDVSNDQPIETVAERRMTELRKTERRMIERRMTKGRMTEGRMTEGRK
jgi:hypothetical protein